MDIETFIAVISFGLTCYLAGVSYGKDHKKKK